MIVDVTEPAMALQYGYVEIFNSTVFPFATIGPVKEIIWIFGTSASGKETFIRTVLNDENLQKILNIYDRKIAVSQESLINLGKLDESRTSIVNEVSSLLKSNEVVMIKWQYGDTLLHSPDALHVNFSKFKHTIVNLNVDRGEQVRRLKTKTWWHDQGRENEFIAKELSLVKDSIELLNPSFLITELRW